MAEQTQEDIKKGPPAEFVKTVREAEGPFRDAIKKYQDKLTPEGKAALEKIAHEEGKAAVEAYKETKNLEDPRIEALRNLAAETLPSERVDLEKGINKKIKKIGMGEVDKIIADDNIPLGSDLLLIDLSINFSPIPVKIAILDLLI